MIQQQMRLNLKKQADNAQPVTVKKTTATVSFTAAGKLNVLVTDKNGQTVQSIDKDIAVGTTTAGQ